MNKLSHQPRKLRYIAYVRKSEVREDRQELSHIAQINAIKERFPDLNIIEWLDPESKSAFTPGRPIFNDMLEMVQEGKADGIVAWHPNRLSRNEIDSATITYMLRDKLKDIKFCSYNFDNSAEGIMMLQMVMNQSQYESSKQGRDVKRGMKQKALTGERPGVVPTGYMKITLKDSYGEPIRHKDGYATNTGFDPERIELVKRMWSMLLSGAYTAAEIRRISKDEWGFTIRKTAKTGGGPMSSSSIYRMFNNPFYAGYIKHNGEMHKGNHEAIITLDEFDYAQKLLGAKGKPRKGVNEYAYSGMIKCGECACSIVGKTNTKFVKRENRMVSYVHYYCTRKSEIRICSQTKYTRVENIEAEIDRELAKFTILPEFRDLALKILNRNHVLEVADRTAINESQTKKRSSIQAQLDKLVDMRTRDLLDDAEYMEQRNRLKLELSKADSAIGQTKERSEKWLELTEEVFDFASFARIRFRNGDLKTKRQILATLGENFELKDGKLTLQQSEWLVPIVEQYPDLEKEYLRRVGTNKKATSKEKEEALSLIFDTWRASGDLNPGHPA